MPKRHSEGALLRRVRRDLAARGIEAATRYVDRPVDVPWASPVVMEVTVRHDGRTYVTHHSTGDRTDMILGFIVARSDPAGPTPPPDMAVVRDAIDGMDGALGVKTDPDEPFMCATVPGCSHFALYRGATLHDIAGREHRVVLQWPFDADRGPRDRERILDRLDRNRTIRQGLLPEPMVAGALAAAIRADDGGFDMADTMPDRLLHAIDNSSQLETGDTEVYDLKAVRLNRGSIAMDFTRGRYRLLDHTFRVGDRFATHDARTLRLPFVVPAMVAQALPGQRLDSVMEGLPYPGDTIIRKARSTKKGLSLELELADVPLAELLAEMRVVEAERVRQAQRCWGGRS